jgi:hypothetical protein
VANITAHRQTLQEICGTFEKAACLMHMQGGCIAKEWPKARPQWNLNQVIQLWGLLGQVPYGCLGCPVCLSEDSGALIHKPWVIATHDVVLGARLQASMLRRSFAHHLPLATGTASERDIEIMAHTIHRAWRASVKWQQSTVPALPGARALPDGLVGGQSKARGS